METRNIFETVFLAGIRNPYINYHSGKIRNYIEGNDVGTEKDCDVQVLGETERKD